MLKRDGLRMLTSGEIALAQQLYFTSIAYNQVWIHHGSYLPFGMQDDYTAMTPNGEMWFETPIYLDDFSLSLVRSQHLFLHEMMHVWQHQRGMMVRMRGTFSWAADYSYDLRRNNLSDYSMEQQASIVSDYWLLRFYDFKEFIDCIKYREYNQEEKRPLLIAKYKNIIGSFPV